MVRKALQQTLLQQVMYDSAYVCAVCQKTGCQVHHIDGDHSNNSEQNLICICTGHHDEAHTQRKLSQNLNQAALLHAKRTWNAAVRSRRETAASVSGQISISGDSSFASMGVTWGHINHQRVIQMVPLESLGDRDTDLLNFCIDRGIVDRFGIPVKPPGAPTATSYLGNTIYDWFDHGDDQRFHKLYVALVDHLSRTSPLIHLEKAWWTKSRIQKLLQPGALIFVQAGFYFKPVSKTHENEHRRVFTTRRGVSIEFHVDTRNMFGTTSMSVSFIGHQSCGAFLQLKSITADGKGRLVLNCTPIALGVAFNKQWS